MFSNEESRTYRTFIFSVIMAIVICLSGVFLGLAIRSIDLTKKEITARARSHFEGIVITRKWNANLGGVYADKAKGIASNPYLKNPDVLTGDGRILTLVNPAYMTRLISEMARNSNAFEFHITSLNPLNPGNAADSFEKAALESFEKGTREASRTVEKDGGIFYRYIAPLKTEKACLNCHAIQGYKVGDIRGGISVQFDITEVEKALRMNNIVIVALSLVTILITCGFIWFLFNQMRKKLSQSRAMLEEMAKIDVLTEVFNRRFLLIRFEEEFNRFKRFNADLSCIIFDIDRFKKINDTYGHLAGDDVLKSLAATVRGALRNYDILGRYGGEEFVVVLPDTKLDDAVMLAERIRKLIEENVHVEIEGKVMQNVTASLGVSCAVASDESVDVVLNRADGALYKAKEGGRNRVVTA